MKNVPTQVSSALAGVIALVAVVHPGFHVSQSVQQIVVIAATALIGVLQSLHLHVSGKVLTALSDERKVVNAILANQNVVPAPVVEAAKAADEIGASMRDLTGSVSTPDGTSATPVTGGPDLKL